MASSWSRKIGRLRYRAAFLAALLVPWWLLSLTFPERFLPSPYSVACSIAEILRDGDFVENMSVTMMRVLVGFSCALALSLAIGIAMGVWRSVETFLEPGVLIGLTIPALCWTAIAVMLLGLGEGPAIFSIIVLVTPMITVNVLAGMKALDRQLIEMAKAFGANRRVILREVVFPQLLPYVLAGSRYGLGLSWKVVVIAEMMGLSSGIGYQIAFSYGMFSLAKVFAWTVSFSAVMFGIEYGLMRPLEKRWTKWQVRAAI